MKKLLCLLLALLALTVMGQAAELPEELKKYSKDGFSVTLMPGEINSDGFFFAKLRKEVKE